MLEISKYLVLSTAHITKRDSELLSNKGWAEDEYGYWVHKDFTSEDLSSTFHACLKLAQQHDCTYVRFDRDGPDVDELTTFDW